MPRDSGWSGERVVVIGAGIGGLTAALELAHAGLDVTVVEAQAAPGGKMRHVIAGGAAVDGGPTVFTMAWVFRALFEALGERLEDHLTLRPATVLARHGWGDGSRLDLFADPARSEQAVEEFAGPAEAAAFRDFSARARRIYDAMAAPFIEAQRPGPLDMMREVGFRFGLIRDLALHLTVSGMLKRTFRDPRLRQLFGRYATYVGGSPFQTPALMSMIWHVEASGVWLVDGGMHEVAEAFARLIAARGGSLRYEAPAAEISVEGGRVSGVRLASGEMLPAGAVIFNGDVAALAAGRLGPGARKAVGAMPKRARSLSALTLAMNVTSRGFPLSHHTVFFCDDYRAEFGDILKSRQLPGEPTVYLCAQDRGEGTPPEGPERILAVINAPADGDIRAFTEAEVAACQDRAFALMRRAGLELEPVEGGIVPTTPSGFEALFPATGGALYGRSPHGPTAAFVRPGAASRLPGLYLAGGSVHPGAGVPMATLSGRLAASALLRDRAAARG